MNTNGKSVFKRVGIVFGTIVASIFLLLITLGTAIEHGYIPDAEALPAGKIHPRYLRQLKQMRVINLDERVLYFYSGSLLSIKRDGNLFTKDRVISYKGYNDELELFSATYDEIVAIDFEPSKAWEDDSIISVQLKDGSWFTLSISTESNGDEKFYRRLLDTWERHRA
jgi:hypothetical protein